MTKRIIYILVLCALASCTKVIKYEGEQVDPSLYVIGDLIDTLGEKNYIFVGETAFFSYGEDDECDKNAEVRVMKGNGEWETLSFKRKKGYEVSVEGMETGDTMWVEVKSKEYETGKGFAVMPPEMEIKIVEIDTLEEPMKSGYYSTEYNMYAILDITCSTTGDWYFNFGITADYEYNYLDRNLGEFVCDTVTQTSVGWNSTDQLFYGDSEVEENVNIWNLIFGDGEESYTHLVMKEPTVRVKVYMYVHEFDRVDDKCRCLGLTFTSKVTSYDRYMYEKTAESALNAEMNPFAEPTQLWNNMKAGEKNAGIFTITRVGRTMYYRED